MRGLELVAVAVGGPPMDHEHQGQRAGGPQCPVARAPDRQGEIGNQPKAVTSPDLYGMHVRQWSALKLRPQGEQPRQASGIPIVAPGGLRREDRILFHDPAVVGVAQRADRQPALQAGLQEGDVRLHLGVERNPGPAQVIDAVGVDAAGVGIHERRCDIAVRILGEHGLLPGRDILGDERGLVPPARVQPVEHPATAVEANGRGGRDVVIADGVDGRLLDDAVGDPQEVAPAVRARPDGQPQPEGVIGRETDEAVVRLYQLQFAGPEVHLVDVVPGRSAVVQQDQRPIPQGVAEADHADPDILERREVPNCARRQVDAIEGEVLVPAFVGDVKDGRGIRGPAIGGDRAFRRVGDRACPGRVVERRDPDVHHATQGGQPGQPLAVRALGDIGALGAAEQRRPRDLRDGTLRGREVGAAEGGHHPYAESDPAHCAFPLARCRSQ